MGSNSCFLIGLRPSAIPSSPLNNNTPPLVICANAMATRFEVAVHGPDPSRLRAAAEEALTEVERLDSQLSFYSSSSDIFRINRRAAHQPVKIEPRLFRLLEHCAELTDKTEGAFDITIGPLMRAWGFTGGKGKIPTDDELNAAREITGMSHVELNSEDFTIRFDREGVEIDLGAIGKGYAVERAADILREVGITSALIHGGTSTIYGIGRPDKSEIPDPKSDIPWRIAIRNPVDKNSHLKVVDLRDNSLSVSAVHGKSFMDGDRMLGHVIDPRTGAPVEGALTAAVVGPSATDCDALSTALLVLGAEGITLIQDRFPEYEGLVLLRDQSLPMETQPK